MRLIELLSEDRIVVPVRSETLRLAAGELVEALDRAGAISDVSRVSELVADTLPRDVVTVGQAFLIYFRTDAVPKLCVGLGIAAESMQREHDPTKEARIVLLISAPPHDASRFLRTVSAFSQALGKEEIVEGLLRAASAKDVLALPELQEIELQGYLTVRDVMVRRRITVRPDTTLGEAARTMVIHNVPSVTVVSETNEVLGLVGHRELLRYLLPLHVKRLTEGQHSKELKQDDEVDPHSTPVREVMDRSVLCLSEDQTVREVATMMLSRNIDRFPVVRDGALIGFLTRGDMVRRLFGR
ncbi:MAG: CBS domain-containing protein [Gemmatimonadales bacterium]